MKARGSQSETFNFAYRSPRLTRRSLGAEEGGSHTELLEASSVEPRKAAGLPDLGGLPDNPVSDARRTLSASFGLVLSGLWFAGVAAWLAARRRGVLRVASLAAIAVGMVAFWSLPHRGQPVSAVNLLGYIPLAWFLALTVWLLVGRSGTPPPGARREATARAGDFRVPGHRVL